MKVIELAPEKFVYSKNGVEFVFDGLDSVTLIKVMGAGPAGSIEVAQEFLAEIHGLELADGTKIQPRHFRKLPAGMISEAVAALINHCAEINKQGEDEGNELESS